MVPICASAWAIWSEAAVSCAEPAESSLMPLPYWEAPLESWLAPLESWLAPLESWAMASTSWPRPVRDLAHVAEAADHVVGHGRDGHAVHAEVVHVGGEAHVAVGAGEHHERHGLGAARVRRGAAPDGDVLAEVGVERYRELEQVVVVKAAGDGVVLRGLDGYLKLAGFAAELVGREPPGPSR